MYSKTQSRFGSGANGLTLRTPSAPIMTISPGSTSRTNSASMMSKAQVSEARIQASPSRPSTSGRTPSGSRTPISASCDSATSEYAPSTWRSASVRRSTTRFLEARRDQVDDDLGIAGRLKDAAAAHQLPAQLVRVRQIAVVADRQPAEVEIGEERLDVAQRDLAGRRIPAHDRSPSLPADARSRPSS